jgi:hypothetical protein
MNEAGRWLKARDLAPLLRVSESTVYRLGRARKLSSRRQGGRLEFFYESNASVTDGKPPGFSILAFIDQWTDHLHKSRGFIVFAGICSVVGVFFALWGLFPRSTSVPMFQKQPNIRVTYFRFEGNLLLERVMNGFGFTPEDGFAAKPFWLKNGVYKDLATMLSGLGGQQTPRRSFDVFSMYAETGNGKEFWFVDTHDGKIIKLGSSTKAGPAGKTIEQIYSQAVLPRGPSFGGPLNSTDLFSRVESDPLWQIDVRAESQPIPFDAYRIVGLPQPAEALELTKDPLSREILKANPDRRDMVVLTAMCEHGAYYARIWIREIKLLAVDFENIGDKPVGLMALKQRTLTPAQTYQARTSADARDMISKSPLEDMRLPLQALRPGEHLMVPLQIQFGIADKISGHTNWNAEGLLEDNIVPNKWWVGRSEQQISFEILKSADVVGNPRTEIRKISHTTIANKPEFSQLLENTYVVGRSVDVEQIVLKVGKGELKSEPVRKFDPNNLMARGAYEAGSCPKLFARKAVSEEWADRGPVLIDAVARAREKDTTVQLEAGTNDFLFAEQENETTYLNRVILVISQRGHPAQIFYSDSGELRKRDGRYIKLQHGQKLRIHFKTPRSIQHKGNWALMITGYYVPDILVQQSVAH